MKDIKIWIIGILLTIIFALFNWSSHREVERVSTGFDVLHKRVNGVVETKMDKEDKKDIQRELDRMWKEIDELKK